MNHDELINMVHTLLIEQKFAALASQKIDQPYVNLVAYAYTDDLKYIFFATRRTTQKYENIKFNNKVSLLIDDRSDKELEISKRLAVTAFGSVREIKGSTREKISRLFIDRNPELAGFINDKYIAIMRISITFYIVATFDSVYTLPIRKKN